MTVIAGLRYILGAAGIVPFPREPALQVVTESVADHPGGSKYAKGAAGGSAAAAPGGGGISRGGSRAGGAANEMTPLLTGGGAAGAMEGVRPKPPTKEDDRACPRLRAVGGRARTRASPAALVRLRVHAHSHARARALGACAPTLTRARRLPTSSPSVLVRAVLD
jgi:hypothetical protein